MKEVLDVCYEKAIQVVKECSTSHGLFASAGKKGYNAVWARDSIITFLGASLIKDGKLKETFKQSLITLASNQSKLGQIPNCVDKYSERKPHVDYQSIDSTLWFIIGEYAYKQNYKDSSLFAQHEGNIKKALIWLQYQDMAEDGMLEQLPTTDWQDAFPHRYGHTINTQALYHKVLDLVNNKKEAKRVKQAVNENEDKKLWDNKLNFYLPWRWKNHNKYQEKGEWFDSLGNLLAILFNLTNQEQSNKILSHIKKQNISSPYPTKAIYPPIKKGTKDWQPYFEDCDAGIPNHYLNGGIWPFIGGFYILSLIKQKNYKEAEYHLEKLAEANLKGNFPEWLSPITKIPYGEKQAWSAGMYILAYESLKKNSLLI